MKSLFVTLFFLSSLIGCRSIQSVSLTQIPSKREKEVQASASRWIFLGFNFDNDYVDEITNQLKQACPKGQVRGILTKDEHVVYFPLFVHLREVHAKGYCVQHPKTVAELEGDSIQ